MKRAFLILAGITLVSAATLKPFSFGQHRAGTSYDVDSLARAGCKREDSAVFVCMERDAKVAGSWAIVQYIISNRRLARLSISGDRDNVQILAAAMLTKYGQPCAKGTETWTSKFGGSFQSGTITWCFETGNLVLHETGLTIETYNAVYTDTANPVPTTSVQPDF